MLVGHDVFYLYVLYNLSSPIPNHLELTVPYQVLLYIVWRVHDDRSHGIWHVRRDRMDTNTNSQNFLHLVEECCARPYHVL